MRKCGWLAVLLVSMQLLAADSGKSDGGDYLVLGIVIWAHPQSAEVAIRAASLFGRLHVEEREYRVKQPGSFLGLKKGDRVTAIFSEKDGMLHRLRPVTPSTAQVRAK